MTVNPLEQSYLKHILIAVEVRDHSAPFRTFFDNWFAFKEGGTFLNANSRPHWFNNPKPGQHGEALRSAPFVSLEASRTLAGVERQRLVKDHSIPVSVLRDIFFTKCPDSTEGARKILLQFYRFGIITETEDRILTAAGLRSRMPDSWTTGDSLFARYDAVSIVAQDLQVDGSILVKGRGERCAAKLATTCGSRIADLLTGTTSKLRFQ